MNLEISKEAGVKYNPVFLSILEDIQGGVTLRTSTLPTDLKILRAGAMLAPDATSLGLYNVVKCARPLKTHTAVTALQVAPGHVFKVGEFINKQGPTGVIGTTNSTITVIRHTSNTTDTIVVATKIGTLSTLSRLFQPASVSSGATLFKHSAAALLRDDVLIHDFSLAVTTLKNISAGAVVRGAIKETATIHGYAYTHKLNLTSRIRFA